MISDYLGNAILNCLFRSVALDIPGVVVSLHTATPGRTGASEVVGGSYTRQTVTFDSATSRATANDIAVLFEDLPTCTITHVGFWDTASPPNFLLGHQLAVSKAYTAGDNGNFPIGDITPSIDWT